MDEEEVWQMTEVYCLGQAGDLLGPQLSLYILNTRMPHKESSRVNQSRI